MLPARLVRLLLAACCAGLLVILAPTTPAPAQAPEPVGHIVHEEGSVLVLREVGASVLATGAPVYAGDRIATGAGARARVDLTDGSSLAIGPGSLVVVSDYRPAETGPLEATVSLFLGIIRAAVAPAVAAEGRFDVETQAAVASARSTRFVVAVEDGGGHAAVFVIAGRVAVRATAPGGETALLDPGLGVDVDRGQSGLDPQRWGRARVQRVLGLTGTGP
ncbi:MAG: hypothetical protein GVY13_09035 [Alphaproteobacteria bacterium]|nr:hypothetical protein [Alphaproteobacteria bacterium]